MDLGLSGLASGFDWRSLVDQLADVERAPQRRLRAEQSTLQLRNNAYGSLKTQLGVLGNRIESLRSPALFDSRLTNVSDATVGTANAAAATPLGAYTFQIDQLATAARHLGTTNTGAALHTSNDVSSLVLSSAGFASPITDGTITVNGKLVTIAASDTLQGVFDKIATATSGTVTGSYDSGADTISLTGTGTLVLGSAADTSNFLEAAKLTNNGTSSVVSTAALGGVRAGVALASANLTSAISDGGSGAGEFKINGVSIQFDASSDSLAHVLERINNSTAGVTASYDAINDRVLLVNKGTGDVGFALEDVTGNFLAATGLTGGTLERGRNLLYRVNGGGTLTSRSNTITEASSGIAGLAVTALKEGASTTVTVSADTARIRTAITDFIADFNKVQSLIDTQTASTTDAKGKVTAGVLAGERDAEAIASALRTLSNSIVSGVSGTVRRLDDLGIGSSGTDNTLTLADASRLEAALSGNLAGVKSLFTDSAGGVAERLGEFLDQTVGDEGSLPAKLENLTDQSADIDTQIANMERLVLANRQQLIDSFVAMETAQARINQQLQFLQQRFGGA